MKVEKSLIITLASHLIFWGVICLFFFNYSFLRPIAVNAQYKELVSVSFIVLMVYANYLFLIPMFLQKSKLAQYWLFAFLSVLISVVLEFLLLKPDILNCYGQTMPKDLLTHFLWVAFIMIFVRNLCFFIIFFLFKVYSDLSESYLLEKQAVTSYSNTITIIPPFENPIVLEINDIIYISHNQNFTYFHLKSGKIYYQHISLRNVEEILPKDIFLRINKGNIVIIPHIIDYKSDSVNMNTYHNATPLTLPISPKYSTKVLIKLKNFPYIKKMKNVGVKNENVGVNAEEKTILSEKNTLPKDEILLSSQQKELLLYMLKYPGSNIADFIRETQKSYRTIERYLKKLKEMNLIVYKGTSKCGGYHLSDGAFKLLYLDNDPETES